MLTFIKTLLIIGLFAGMASAQFNHKSITLPETALSDAFKPLQNYYLTGINFNSNK